MIILQDECRLLRCVASSFLFRILIQPRACKGEKDQGEEEGQDEKKEDEKRDG